MRIPLILLCLLTLSLCAAQTFTKDFATGPEGAGSYHKAPDDLKIEHLPERYLRAELPGKKPLEGYYVTFTGLTGGRVATAEVLVRGQGELWLCLISANGWLYSPETRKLSADWQTVSLSKVLSAKDTTLGVYLISQKAQPGAVFECDRVCVTLAAPPATKDVAVPAWRVEAEEFAPRLAMVAADPAALGKKTLRQEQYLTARGLPFPRTSRPVTVYARVLADHPRDTLRLGTILPGPTQILQTVTVPKTGQWQWIKFAPLTAGEVGSSFSVDCQRDKDTRGFLSLDSLVISTEPALSDEQLMAAPELLGRRPFLAVTKTTEPPVIDGDFADWNAEKLHLVASGFVGVGSRVPVSADTRVTLRYDDTNLYVHCFCVEPLLDPAQQRMHEFKAKVTQRDGEVYQDDSVILLLQPPGSKRVYDFTINALGTIEDAVCTGPDLWGSRDVKWNSRAVAKGKVELAWRMEMAIPWADLGGAPNPGDRWQACFGRIAKGRKEQSSWNLSDKGFHDPVELGTLQFLGQTEAPYVLLQPPASLKLKANLLGNPGPTEWLTLFTETRLPSSIARQYGPTFDVPPETNLEIAYGALDAATLQPYVLTPVLPAGVQSLSVDLTIAAEGPWELLLNEQTLERGPSATAQKITVPLQRGLNVLALKLAQGTAAAKLELPQGSSFADCWKLPPADAPAASMAFFDEGCPAAPKVSEHPQLGPVVGTPEQPLTLRRTILFESTRAWPTPEPALYFAQGPSQHFTIVYPKLKGRKLLDWTTYVALPPELEVTGSTGFYGGNRVEQPFFRSEPAGERKLGGRTLRVWKISADKPLLPNRHPIMAQFEVFLKIVGAPATQETSLLFWSEANGGALSECPQTVKVRLLPALRGQQCKRLVWQLWGGWFSNLDDLALREQVLACAQAAGFTDIVSGDRWTGDNAPRYGLTHTTSTNFEPWCMNLGPYLTEHPDQRLLKSDGKPSEKLMCMTLLLGEGWSAVRAALAAQIEKTRPNTVDYDYEYGPAAGPHSCYCPRCLAVFRAAARLPADAPLDAATIKAQYWPQWVDFTALRVAQMMRKLKDAVHELSPGAQFSVYSGYQTPDNPERYGIDWHYIGELQACDHAGCGYGRPVEAIGKTIEALKGIPLTGGLLLTPYETDITTPQTPLTKAWLFRTLLDSTGGILAYDRCTMDGRTWYAMAETTRLVAPYEELFLTAKREALAGVDPAQGVVLRDAKRTLVCLMNGSSKPLSLKATLPTEFGGGKAFYNGKAVKPGETVQLELPGGEAEVLVLGGGD